VSEIFRHLFLNNDELAGNHGVFAVSIFYVGQLYHLWCATGLNIGSLVI